MASLNSQPSDGPEAALQQIDNILLECKGSRHYWPLIWASLFNFLSVLFLVAAVKGVLGLLKAPLFEYDLSGYIIFSIFILGFLYGFQYFFFLAIRYFKLLAPHDFSLTITRQGIFANATFANFINDEHKMQLFNWEYVRDIKLKKTFISISLKSSDRLPRRLRRGILQRRTQLGILGCYSVPNVHLMQVLLRAWDDWKIAHRSTQGGAAPPNPNE